MNIVVLCPHFEDTGGVREVVSRLAIEHLAAGHHVDVISRVRAHGGDTEDAPHGLRLHRVPMAPAPFKGAGWRTTRQFLRRFARGSVLLAGQIRRLRPDVIAAHCSKLHAPWVAVAEAAGHAPVVLHLHNADRTADGPPSRFWSRRLLTARRRVIAVSPAVAAYALAVRPELRGRVVVVRNGVDPTESLPADAERRPAPFVLGVGRLAHQKGFDVLVSAFASVPPPTTLVLAGHGPDANALRAHAEGLGIADRVEFLGEVPRRRVRSLLRGAAVVAMPSRFEGNPLIAIEAMQAGAPFVATAIPGLPDELRHGETGLLVPSDDPAELAAAMTRLLADPAEARRLGHAAAEASHAMPAWAGVAAQVLAIYLEAAHST